MVPSTGPAKAVVKAEIEGLEAICVELSRRGWPARVVRFGVLGEMDVRLQVGAFGALMVELLGPFGDRPCGDRWQAVRVTPGSREVWCGPPRSRAVSEAIGFVEHLLSRHVEEVTGGYDRLG